MVLWHSRSVGCLSDLDAGLYQPGLDNGGVQCRSSITTFVYDWVYFEQSRARSFAVALLAIFGCKSEQLKAVGKIGLIPSMFGISEPIKFGIPQVMNIRMLLPLMLTPAVSVLSAYLLTIVGFCLITMESISQLDFRLFSVAS